MYSTTASGDSEDGEEEMKNERLKAWFCYSGDRGFYSCVMILENGWAPFSHICSHPYFAPGDLFFGRSERMKAFKDLGIEIDPQGICKDTEVPEEVYDNNMSKTSYKEMSERYKALGIET